MVLLPRQSGLFRPEYSGNPKLAIRYAKRIIKDGEGRMPADIAPGTKVYELVEELAKYLPETVKWKFHDQ